MFKGFAMPDQEPTLLFFRERPTEWNTNVSIASSMQALETSFFLIALGRYPHALAICANAIESAIQGAGIGTARDMLQSLIDKAAVQSTVIQEFCEANDNLGKLRKARNRITHDGFSPRDDSPCVSLYLEQGLPFLSLCYRELHKFDLMGGLLPEYVEHIHVAERVNSLAKAHEEIDLSYCLRSFEHLLRWSLKSNFSASWEIDALIHDDEIGGKFEKTETEKSRIKRLFDVSWTFDCPICDNIDSVVADLDNDKLDTRDVFPNRMACVDCGFVVTESHPFLASILLEGQIYKVKETILNEYGID